MLAIALIITLSAGIAVPGSALPTESKVRVRVHRAATVVQVTGLALQITSPHNLRKASAVSPTINEAKIRRRGQGWQIHWKQGLKSEWVKAERLRITGKMLRIAGTAVPYSLEVVTGAKSGLDVVASLDLETYLLGVLPAEMPASWPLEALKAQAVASRTFALRSANERKSRSFDVDSTVMDQVYTFLHGSQKHPEWRERIRRAVAETKGEILHTQSGDILKAFFSADCGCQSEDPAYVWGAVEDIESIRDPSCNSRPVKRWRALVHEETLHRNFRQVLKLRPTEVIESIQIKGRTPSGRVAEVLAFVRENEAIKVKSFTSQKFRQMIGFDKILSTNFKLSWESKVLKIEGQGSGHAVGLCQTGAKTLAETQHSYRSILKIFYPKAVLRRSIKPV